MTFVFAFSHEAMTDLIKLMASMVDVKGKILIPGIYDTVAPVTEEEKKLYAPIEFDMQDYCKDMGHCKLPHDSKEQILMHRWRFPTLSLHGGYLTKLTGILIVWDVLQFLMQILLFATYM